ncbi:MAG: nuclear transport factor 2 family protein [Patulibacter sp.]
MSTTEIPTVITRYQQAEQDADWTALADCFLPEGVAFDEGRTHVGREEIAAWRTAVAAAVTFTSTVVERRALGADGFKLVLRLEGDFPGGVAELDFLFALRDERIAALVILPASA